MPEQERTVGIVRLVIAFVTSYWRSFSAAIAAGVFLALSGAFFPAATPLPLRLLFWAPSILFGTVIGQIIGIRMARRPQIGERALIVWGGTTLLVTAVLTPILWGYARLLFGPPYPGPFFYFLADAGMVGGAMTAIMILINRPGPATHAAPIDGAFAMTPVRFLDRIPGKLRGADIYAVQSEDHYLRVRTSKGSDLILMRLSDAIAELEGIEGAQTHRSWWVAKDGIAAVSRAGGRVTLQLKDGAEAPVSRPNVRALRESRWI